MATPTNLGSKATDGRIQFIKFVQENKSFDEIKYEIVKGKNAIVYVKKGSKIVLTDKELKSGTKITITDNKMFEISKIKFAQVKFRGGSGFIQIDTIATPVPPKNTKYEDEVVDLINTYILNSGGSINIKLNGDSVTYKDIAYAVKVTKAIKSRAGVKGDPKADIILCKNKLKPLAPGSIYISHKKAGGPQAFQQYGGVSEQAGVEINKNKIVQKFLKIVSDILVDTKDKKLPHPAMGTFKNVELANLAIYGPEYGGAFSVQHVQVIGQGKPTITENKTHVIISFDHMGLSGDIRQFKSGYEPVLGATYRAGRGFVYRRVTHKGARVAIYPYKKIAASKKLKTFIIK